jgi:hypothetical protein
VRRWVAAAAFSHELPEELLLKVLDEVARGEGGGARGRWCWGVMGSGAASEGV